jgi:hypothetical protein
MDIVYALRLIRYFEDKFKYIFKFDFIIEELNALSFKIYVQI